MSNALALVKFVESSGDHTQLLTLGHKQVTVSIWTNAALRISRQTFVWLLVVEKQNEVVDNPVFARYCGYLVYILVPNINNCSFLTYYKVFIGKSFI
jgi:hypothetical protein